MHVHPVGTANTAVLERAVDDLAARYNMQWQIAYTGKPKQVAILVSRMNHCLYDLLIRHKSGEPLQYSSCSGP